MHRTPHHAAFRFGHSLNIAHIRSATTRSTCQSTCLMNAPSLTHLMPLPFIGKPSKTYETTCGVSGRTPATSEMSFTPSAPQLVH